MSLPTETECINFPYRLPCGVELPNRLAKSAMSEQLGDAGHAPTAGLATLYGRWSQGGAGLLVTGNVMIDRRALGEPRNVVLEDERDMAALQAPAIINAEAVAPSAVALNLGPGVFGAPRALEASEIEELVARFGRSARLAKQAGFTGVQIHAAHGYLISQFLSPHTNRREDGWGGTPEKRRRFLLAIVAAMRSAIGPDFPIGVKLNSADFQRGGFSEAESLDVIVALEQAGVDLLEISGGTYEKPAMMDAADSMPDGTENRGSSRAEGAVAVAAPVKASTAAREAYFLAFARQVRRCSKIPLMLTGGFRSRAAMAQALLDGAIDVVGLARPLAVEPDLPRRLLDGVSGAAVPMPNLNIGFLAGFIDIVWHAQQMQRMANGQAPNVNRSPWLALAIAGFENGWGALTRKRGF